jgi:phage gp36-like protein
MAYADRTDLVRLGLRAEALTGVTTDAQDAALEAASDVADSYLRARYELPLTAWGDDLRRAVAAIAALDVMTARGFSPAAGADDLLMRRQEQALTWLKDVAANRATVSGGNTTPTTSTRARATGPTVASRGQRGW